MKHETPTMTARVRERCGSRYARRLRTTGRLPAVIYGHKAPAVSISVDEAEILHLLRHGTHALYLDVEGAGTETCLVKELQYGYLGDNVIHVDFARVDLEDEVTVKVHIAFVGTPHESLKTDAILRHDQTELSVTCQVKTIPEEIKVDLSRMEGLQFTAGEIPLPPGVTLADKAGSLVASIMFVHGEEEAVGEEAEVTEAEAEPEVITEAKEGEAPAEKEAGKS